MKFVNFDDPSNRWDIDVVCDIVTKVKSYCDSHQKLNAEIVCVEDNTWADKKNMRYDIEIQYLNDKGRAFYQKLLILKGEVIDGEEFHKRFSEFYPEKVA